MTEKSCGQSGHRTQDLFRSISRVADRSHGPNGLSSIHPLARTGLLDRFISMGRVVRPAQWDLCERWKKSVRDWLEVFRQTFFGITQDFDDGLTVDKGEFGVLIPVFFPRKNPPHLFVSRFNGLIGHTIEGL